MSNILGNHPHPTTTDSDDQDEISDASQPIILSVPTESLDNSLPASDSSEQSGSFKNMDENTSSLSGFFSGPQISSTLHHGVETENMRLKKEIKSHKRKVRQLQHDIATLDGKLETHTILYNQLLDCVDHSTGTTRSSLVPISTSEKVSGLTDVISITFASYTPLDCKDFRDIRTIYWTRSDFNSAKTKSRGVLKWGSNKRKTTRTTDDAESVESDSKGNEKAGALLFLVDKHGKVLSETRQKDICSFQRIDSITQLYYYGCMRTWFPELQLCEGDWKVEAMAVEYYHGWVDRLTTGTAVKIESKDTKIKGEKSRDPSLALEALRSSSSKRPTSLTVLQSERAKKQRVLLADGTSESSESISTSITMKKPVPASPPALQVSQHVQQHWRTRHYEIPQSQPTMHIQVSTASSSDSAQPSGKSVTPLLDSVPLPSSSTLAFLATALNNASLEGSTSPHISPPSATSTGDVLTQPVKKKRGPTNPNNVFKPSSGSTTARNLCGIEWQAQHKTGTVAEFTHTGIV
ncbi:uncharacterized protein F5147DRAFT_783962 [Suillus discolor]|uniref:Uncharacterized protein n=1 Tax=Suillus discolor TaxID=1912936 RepID=A0A9P7JL41_9AGAM|nr:uncharacterized protein F5147DRAFT_783962 [Suillus discolor]KAG2081017.1 hypothetical protein F5147DRAFT_783962 [Suillus discolor]